MLTSFYIFQKLIKLPMNLNLHFVPMNVCKISDQNLKGKLFYFSHNININFNFSIRSPYQETWLPTYRVTTLSYIDQQYCLTLLGLTLLSYEDTLNKLELTTLKERREILTNKFAINTARNENHNDMFIKSQSRIQKLGICLSLKNHFAKHLDTINLLFLICQGC